MNEFFANSNRIRSHRSDVKGSSFSWWLRNSSQVVIPSSCGMLVYSQETSKVNRRQPGGSWGNLRNLLMKSVLSWICNGIWITLGCRKKNWRSVRCSLSGHHSKLQWVCPGYQAYESLPRNKIWLPMDTEGLGISLFFISAFFDTSSPRAVSPPSYIEMLGPREALRASSIDSSN